jgi:hypothetical protein
VIRDTWRAVLVVVTAALLREIILLPRPAVPAAAPAVATNWQAQPPTVATGWQPQWQPPAVATGWQAPPAPPPPPPPPPRRLAAVGRSVVELADSVLDVVR